jgi:hypothetical protein
VPCILCENMWINTVGGNKVLAAYKGSSSGDKENYLIWSWEFKWNFWINKEWIKNNKYNANIEIIDRGEKKKGKGNCKFKYNFKKF